MLESLTAFSRLFWETRFEHGPLGALFVFLPTRSRPMSTHLLSSDYMRPIVKCCLWNWQHCEILFNHLQYSWGISDRTLSVDTEHNPHLVKPAKSVTDFDLFNLILAVQYFQRTGSNFFNFSRIKTVYSAKSKMASSMERLFSATRRTCSYKNDPPSILGQSRTCFAYLGAMVTPLPNGNAHGPQLTTWTLPSPNVSRPFLQIIRLSGTITLSRIK